MKTLFCLMMLLSALSPHALPDRTTLAMKSGVLLRMHVIAPDDTPAMQQMKLHVRDAVRHAYASSPARGLTMLARTRFLLPSLTAAARQAAGSHGYDGPVTLSVEQASFDERTLDGHVFPAGDYPALIIRLGEARGRNWWGLVDPSLALSCAALGEGELIWDWSLPALWQALWPFAPKEVPVCE